MTIATYDDFWGSFFGLEAERLRRPGVNVVEHAHLRGYPGVWFFVRGSSVVVSAPAAWLDRLRSRTMQIAAHPLPGPPLLRELFGRDPERVIGPAYQGCLVREGFQPMRDAHVRRLSSSYDSALADLRAASSSEEWEHSALGTSSEPRFGYFEAGRLVAAAGTDPWTADAVGPGVLTHPDHRGRGHATAVVSAVVEHALAAGKLLLYQTLTASTGAVKVAERLGYQQYATHLAIRVQPEAV